MSGNPGNPKTVHRACHGAAKVHCAGEGGPPQDVFVWTQPGFGACQEMCCFWQLSERTATRDRGDRTQGKERGVVFGGRKGQNMTGSKRSLCLSGAMKHSVGPRTERVRLNYRICLITINMYAGSLFQWGVSFLLPICQFRPIISLTCFTCQQTHSKFGKHVR